MIAGPLALNEPSLEFKELLRSLSNQATNLVKTYEKIMDMGIDEGFSEKEIKEMVKSELRDVKTRHELYYIFNKEKINQRNTQNYQNKKMLTNTHIEGKKDTEDSSTSTDYKVEVTNKPKIIDVQSENVVKESKMDGVSGPIGVEMPQEMKPLFNTLKTLKDSGFDTEKAITVIKGNPSQVLYQLEAYKQQNIKEMLIILQKVS